MTICRLRLKVNYTFYIYPTSFPELFHVLILNIAQRTEPRTRLLSVLSKINIAWNKNRKVGKNSVKSLVSKHIILVRNLRV